MNENGKALVICSSLALIEQQVNYLNSLNLRAVTITHNVVDHERSILMNELRSRESNIKFLYVTPEMIEKSNTVPPLIRDLCESGSFSFVVIDDGLRLEGYRDDRFRENVVYLRALRERNVKLKWIVMTTSSEAEINQIKQEFGFEDAVVIQSASFDRADIFLGVRVINMVRENLIAVFLHDVREALGAGNQPGSGLIYTKYSQDVTLLTKLLGEIGIDAKPFNGKGDGLRNFNDWLSGFFPVLVATSESLRYGIVKRPLAFVFHYHPSKALKDYYQARGVISNSIEDFIYFRLNIISGVWSCQQPKRRGNFTNFREK